MGKTSLHEILDMLYLDELKEIAYSFGLPQNGSKGQIIQNIIDKVPSHTDLIGLLKADELKAICEKLGIKTGKKDDMVTFVLQAIDGDATAAESVKATAPPEYMEATIDNVIAKIRELTIPKRKVKTEKDAENEIGDCLSEFFRAVMSQYNLGGYLGLKIDLDIDNGKVGIETKLASSLLDKNTSEIFRMIGQGVYYQRKRYGDNFVIAVAGTESDLDYPVIREALSFLSSINIKWVGVQIK